MRIAIVEDTDEWQRKIKEAFEKQNHTIVGTYLDTSQATYQSLLTLVPDILILDIELETKTSGAELFEKLARTNFFKTTGVVFLTGKNDIRFMTDTFQKATTHNTIPIDYIEKNDFIYENTNGRLVKKIIAKKQNQIPPPLFISIPITKREILIEDIFWVRIDKEHEMQTGVQRLEIAIKNPNALKEIIYLYKENINSFTDPTKKSSLYAHEKLEQVHKHILVNMNNRKGFSHPENRLYYIHFSEDKEDLSMRIKMSQQKGTDIFNRYVR